MKSTPERWIPRRVRLHRGRSRRLFINVNSIFSFSIEQFRTAVLPYSMAGRKDQQIHAQSRCYTV
jgi:hypothetical protein